MTKKAIWEGATSTPTVDGPFYAAFADVKLTGATVWGTPSSAFFIAARSAAKTRPF